MAENQIQEAKFKDRTGFEWELELDGPTVEKIQEAIGLEISAEDGTGLIRCLVDRKKAMKACLLICADQIDDWKRHVKDQLQKEGQPATKQARLAKKIDAAKDTDAAFDIAMSSGEALDGAVKALRQAVTFFTPPSRRQLLIAALDQAEKTIRVQLDTAAGKLADPRIQERMKQETEQAIDERLENAFGTLRTAFRSSAKDSLDSADAPPKE